MDNSFLAYLERLEMMAFFSGYPLVYYAIVLFKGNKKDNENTFTRAFSLLPYVYALLGTLFLGLLLKNLYPDYSIEHINLKMQQPYLIIWGLSAILFWLPVLNTKPVYSLIHSLVFFFFLAKDILFHLIGYSNDEHIVRNDMKIYSLSIIFILIALAFIVLFSFLGLRYARRPRS
jgi:hypothetical protein